MSAPTVTRGSAYPPAIEALLPQARELAERLGALPSRNRLKTELRVGGPKASAVRDALAASLDTAPDATPAEATPEMPEPTEADTPVSNAPAEPAPIAAPEVPESSPLVTPVVDPGVKITLAPARTPRKPLAWPVLLLAMPAFVAIWSGWVDLGELCGFGVVHPLPGIWDDVRLNTAITLPIGVEAYAAYALWVWLSARAPQQARGFAKWSAIGSLLVGAGGQIAYHLMSAAHVTTAPWPITAAVACLPVAVLGMGAALAHLLHADHD